MRDVGFSGARPTVVLRARVYITLGALLLLGCSVPVHGAIERLSNSVELHCGWVRQQLVAPAAECVVYEVDGDARRLLLDDADPCEAEPVSKLRVDAGHAISQWGHLTSGPVQVYVEPCEAQ